MQFFVSLRHHSLKELNFEGCKMKSEEKYVFKISQLPEEKEALLLTEEYQEQLSESTFLFLTLDLPTAPLYKDEKEQLIIPQVPLFNILGKFNGSTEKVTIPSHRLVFDIMMQNKSVKSLTLYLDTLLSHLHSGI